MSGRNGGTGPTGEAAAVAGITDRELMRLLHEELPAPRRQEIEAAVARRPEIAARLARLATVWEGLELPPAAPPPAGYAARVAARAAALAAGDPALAWRLAPVWVRASAALVLATGIALGALVTSRMETPAGAAGQDGSSLAGPTLAETWAETFSEARVAEDAAGGSR